MGIIHAVRLFRGYVRFAVSGERPERFINLCAQGGVPLWDGKRHNGSYTACTTVAGSRRLREYANRAGLSLETQRERGAPAFVRRYRRRIGLAAGALLLCAAAFVTGSFIWTVDINGLKTLSEQEVMEVLSELGVRKGVWRRSIDVRETERRLLLSFDELSWAGVNLRGSTATIELSERTMPPDMVEDDRAFNVVAQSSGYITAMEVYNGQPMYKVGDSVKAGEVLVSGIMEAGWGGSRYVHARAKVTAQTVESLEVFVPYKQEKLIPSGKEQRMYLDVYGARLPLFFSGAPAEPNSVECSYSDIPLLTKLTSVRLITEDYTLYTAQTEMIDPDRARELALEWLASEEELKLGEASILSRDHTGQELTEGFNLFCSYICEKIISKEVEIFMDK